MHSEKTQALWAGSWTFQRGPGTAKAPQKVRGLGQAADHTWTTAPGASAPRGEVAAPPFALANM
jgi:hypothetical protein